MSYNESLTNLSLDTLASIVSDSTPPDQSTDNKVTALPTVKEKYPPLSYAQERLVFMDRLSKGNSFYNMAYGYTMKGDLNSAAFEKAWLHVIDRHEALRSTFPNNEKGAPCIRFLPLNNFALQHKDIRKNKAAHRTEFIEEVAYDMITAPYDLAKGPLARGVLIRQAENEFSFIYGFHHSVFDGWSQAIFNSELSMAYAAYAKETTPNLPIIPASHGRYALWQRNSMEGAYGEQERQWWQRYLSDAEDLHLVADNDRPSNQSFKGECITFSIPITVCETLKKVADQASASPFMLWTAIYAIVLGKYSGQRLFTIGSSLAGRSHPDTESIIGFLVNNLVVKINNNPDHSFSQHLEEVRNSVLTSYEHGELPFQMVAQCASNHPDIRKNPIYQATLTYQNTPMQQHLFEGISCADIPFPVSTTHVDIDVLMWPSEKELTCCLLYATDIFSRETADAYCRALQETAKYVAEHPDIPLKQLMTMDEVLPNPPGETPSFMAAPEDQSPHRSPWQRLTEHAKRSPNSTALILDDKSEDGSTRDATTVSFSKLSKMATSIANDLDGNGVGTGEKTLILLHSGVELFIATFAVWHRGGAWLLVDPDTPRSRLTSILEEFSPDSIITMTDLLDKDAFESHLLPENIHMITDWPAIQSGESILSPLPNPPDTPAMFFCTSGSTGKPKIAPCTHDAVSKRLTWEMTTYPLGEGDLGCLKSSVAYADFFYEVFVPILSAVPLLLIGHYPAMDVQRLIQKIEHHQVTRLVSVPSLLKTMHRLTQGFKGRMQCLRSLRTSGEAMPTQLAEALVDAIPGLTLYSVYGSLEMHNPTAFCYSRDGDKHSIHTPNIPAGAPLPGRKVILLDEYDQPVPKGKTGEICAGGWGLVPGYLSGANNDAFQPLPGHDPDEIWYKSGDMGYIDDQDMLNVTGRKDFQIKLRGVRIEPGEVEGAMSQSPQITEAKVHAWEDSKGNQRLHGFAIPETRIENDNERRSLIEQLRSTLLEKLPAVMVPDSITLLEDWPRTATGKTDLLQLKEAYRRENTMTNRFEQAQYRGEEKDIARIWTMVLGNTYPIDAQTSFFKAGGNSLLLVNLHGELQRAFRREFPLTLLFQNPTIESQAKLLTHKKQTTDPGKAENASPQRRTLLSRRKQRD